MKILFHLMAISFFIPSLSGAQTETKPSPKIEPAFKVSICKSENKFFGEVDAVLKAEEISKSPENLIHWKLEIKFPEKSKIEPKVYEIVKQDDKIVGSPEVVKETVDTLQIAISLAKSVTALKCQNTKSTDDQKICVLSEVAEKGIATTKKGEFRADVSSKPTAFDGIELKLTSPSGEVFSSKLEKSLVAAMKQAQEARRPEADSRCRVLGYCDNEEKSRAEIDSKSDLFVAQQKALEDLLKKLPIDATP